jgi:hypothetical protein
MDGERNSPMKSIAGSIAGSNATLSAYELELLDESESELLDELELLDESESELLDELELLDESESELLDELELLDDPEPLEELLDDPEPLEELLDEPVSSSKEKSLSWCWWAIAES